MTSIEGGIRSRSREPLGLGEDMDLIVHGDGPTALLNEFSEAFPKEEVHKLQADLKRMVWGQLHTKYMLMIMGLIQLVCGMQFALTPYILNEPPRFPVCEGVLGGEINQPSNRRLQGVPMPQADIKVHDVMSEVLTDVEKVDVQVERGDSKSLCLPDEPLEDFDCTSDFIYYFDNTSVVEAFRVPSYVCEPNPLLNTSFPRSALLAGFGVGAFLNGLWMDKFGRKRLVSVSIVVFILSGLSVTMSSSILEFFCWRFLTGYAMSGMSIGSLVLLCELTNRRNRRKIFAMYVLSFCCGTVVTAIMGCLIYDWQFLVVAVTVPTVLLPFWQSCVPFNVESPRYYLSHGDDASAMAIYRKIANYNGHNLAEKIQNINENNVREFVEALFDDIDEDEIEDVEVEAPSIGDIESSPHSDTFLFNPELTASPTATETFFGVFYQFPIMIWLWNCVILYALCQTQYYGITLDMNSYQNAYEIFQDSTGIDVDNYLWSLPSWTPVTKSAAEEAEEAEWKEEEAVIADEVDAAAYPAADAVDAALRRLQGAAWNPDYHVEGSPFAADMAPPDMANPEAAPAGPGSGPEDSGPEAEPEPAPMAADGFQPAMDEAPPAQEAFLPPAEDFQPPADEPVVVPVAMGSIPQDSLMEESRPEDDTPQAPEEALPVPDADQDPIAIPLDEGSQYTKGGSWGGGWQGGWQGGWDSVKNGAIEKYERVKSMRLDDIEGYANAYYTGSLTVLTASMDPDHPLATYFKNIRSYSYYLFGMTALELVFQLFAIWLCGFNLFGRRSIILGWLFTAGLVLAATGILKIPFAVSHIASTFPESVFYIGACFSRLLTVGAMVVLQLFMIELFPTSVRGGIYGLAVLIGTACCVVAPAAFSLLENIFPGSFALVLAAVAMLMSFFSLVTIPDTLTRPSYDTVNQLLSASAEDPHASSTLAPCKYCCMDFLQKICCCCYKNSEYQTLVKDMMTKKKLKRTALIMVLEGKKELTDVMKKTKRELGKLGKTEETERLRDD